MERCIIVSMLLVMILGCVSFAVSPDPVGPDPVDPTVVTTEPAAGEPAAEDPEPAVDHDMLIKDSVTAVVIELGIIIGLLCVLIVRGVLL